MTKFTKSILRIILPLTSLGIFLIASLIVLVISQGRIFDNNGSIVETGIIRVTSIPNDSIKAFINNQEVSFSESRITNITPGIITLKLIKEGYSPWEKRVKVESGFVKDVFAQLYPDTIPFAKAIEANVDKVFYAPDNQFIYYTILNDRALNGIWRFKLTRNLLDFTNTNQNTQIVKFNEVESNQLTTNNYNLLISADNNKIILKAGNSNYYLYNLTDPTKKIDLEELIGTRPENINWFRGSEAIIFTKENKYAFEYEINSKQTSLIVAQDSIINNLAIAFNSIYFVKDNIIYKYNNKATIPFEFSTKLKPLIPTKLTQVYTPKDNQNTMVLESEDSLIYLDIQKNYIDVIDTNSTLSIISNNGRTLLYTKDNELYSYYLEDGLSGESFNAFNYALNANLDNIDNIEFTGAGNNLVVIGKDGIVTLMDFDGLNKKQILNEFKLGYNKLLFTNGNKDIYALIEEKDDNSTTVKNVYKFELELD